MLTEYFSHKTFKATVPVTLMDENYQTLETLEIELELTDSQNYFKKYKSLKHNQCRTYDDAILRVKLKEAGVHQKIMRVGQHAFKSCGVNFLLPGKVQIKMDNRDDVSETAQYIDPKFKDFMEIAHLFNKGF